MPSTVRVGFSQMAEADVQGILDYLTEARGLDHAIDFVTELLDRVAALETFPKRGSVPKELEAAGETEIRQIIFERYRIFYELDDEAVVVILVADGRRDMQQLLRGRLTRPADDA